MELTQEQNEICESEGNIIIDAVSGSGKTSTLVEYAKKRPDKKFLYLCFNRSVRDSAESKFPENVEIKNTHSLAYRWTNAYQWKLAKSFDAFDVINILKIKKKIGVENFDAKIAGHILTCLNSYTNSNILEVDDFDYLNYSDSTFSDENLEQIQDGFKSIYGKMGSGEIPIIHNFYLKEFQKMEPNLDYDYILLDESQDTNPCVIDIFSKQNTNKIVVGDAFQAIYSWIGAENALLKFNQTDDYQKHKLTNSFRFRQDVANLAMQIIELKKHIGIDVDDFKITGIGNCDKLDSHAYIARSNVNLIIKAAEVVSQTRDSIHFEGNINNYIFADGVGIYDVFNLWSGNKAKLRNKFLKKFDSYEEYRDFLSEIGNSDQEILCSLVEKYKRNVFKVIEEIRKRNINKEEADIVLSTTHKAKGLEYNTVELANDFITESNIIESETDDYPRLSEEINALYVATTRTQNKIDFPFHYLEDYAALNKSKL